MINLGFAGLLKKESNKKTIRRLALAVVAASCVVSLPTRASVLTGRNPYRTGVYNAHVGILRPEEITLPELLHEEGYATGYFGKWHLGALTATQEDSNRGKVINETYDNYRKSFVGEEYGVESFNRLEQSWPSSKAK